MYAKGCKAYIVHISPKTIRIFIVIFFGVYLEQKKWVCLWSSVNDDDDDDNAKHLLLLYFALVFDFFDSIHLRACQVLSIRMFSLEQLGREKEIVLNKKPTTTV